MVRSLTTAEWVKAKKESVNEDWKRKVINWKEVDLAMYCIVVWKKKTKKQMSSEKYNKSQLRFERKKH